MSGEFKVTREMAQELAETGAIQIPVDVLVGDIPSGSAMSLRSDWFMKKPIDFSEYRASESANRLGGLVEDLFRHSGEGQVSTCRTTEWTSHRGEDWHVDPETSQGGITVIITSWMRHPEKKCESLEIAGRGSTQSATVNKLWYANGPVIIAQQGFGNRLLNNSSPCGGARHKSKRMVNSRLRVIDFR